MSLQVWLPLNGDTTQQGLISCTMTGSPNAWQNGKIGKCAYWNGNVGNVVSYNTTVLNYTDNFSVAFWAKPIYTGSTAQYAFTMGRADAGSYGYGFNITSSTNATFRFGNGVYNVSAPSNEWHHYTMTVGNSKVIIYKDGVQVSENGMPSTLPSYSVSESKGLGLGCFHYTSDIYPYYGCLNDFRIYDHTLSPQEVKELAKGLVLWYPLDDGYIEGTTNLASSSTGGWNNSGNCIRLGNDTSLDSTKPTSGPVTSVKVTTTGNCALTCGTSSNNLPSKTLTFSIWCYLSGPQEGNTIYIRSTKTDGGVGSFEYNGSANPLTWPTNKWIRLEKTITTASDATTFYFCTYVNILDRYVALNGWQIEEKDHATPWTTPGTSRTTGSVYDCSGYQHNGSINGALTVLKNTPKYEASTHFSSNTQYIRVTDLNTSAFGNSYTFTWWAKASDFGTINMMWGFADGNRFNCFHTGPYWNTGDSQNNPIYSSGTIIATTPGGGQWHFFAAVGDGSTSKAYVDGQLWGTAKTYKPITGNTIVINGWSTGTDFSYSNLDMSDFRIYATPLSAADVLSLYHNNAYIDSSNTIHGPIR